MNSARHKPPLQSFRVSSTAVWLVFFLYSATAAVVFQKILLPMAPSLHAGNGLLFGDSQYFHTVALALAAKIAAQGWGAWSVYPDLGATGNVAVLGALYALFGVNPAWMIPLNAAVHALGGLLIFKITRLLAPDENRRTAALIAATLFVIFPSALNWYAQVHKDGFAIAGVLLVVWAWMWARDRAISGRDCAIFGGAICAGVSLLLFVRPYSLVPLVAVATLVFCVLLATDLCRLRSHWRVTALCALSIAVMAMAATWSRQTGLEEHYVATDSRQLEWQTSPWLPSSVDSQFETLARLRTRLIASGVASDSQSMIDIEVRPDRAAAVLAYAPRALQIAAFAPFPADWFEKISATRLVAVLEMLCWYAIAPGVLCAFAFCRSSRLLVVFLFAIAFLFIHGFTIANIGTLYRVRYAYLFLLIAIGMVGWAAYFHRRQQP